jgi:Histidine kinase/Two component regulator propeller
MSYLRKYLFVFILLMTNYHSINSQNPNAIVINKLNGLPSNEVYNIFQDSKGFIWIAHNEGLSKYDGYQFFNFQNKLQTSKAGTLIQEDQYGRIWYENFDGYLYYVEHDSLHILKQNTSPGFFHYGIVENHIYVLQNNGIDVFNLKNLQIIKTLPLQKDELAFTHATKKNFYVYNHNDLYRINNLSFEFELINYYGKTQLTKHGVLFSDDTHILMYGNDVNDKYCYATNENTYAPKFNHNIQDFIQAASYIDHSIWFCTTKGVYAFGDEGQILNQSKPYFKDKSISCAIKDREGNFWFSSTNEGILFVPDLKSNLFKSKFKIKKIARYDNKIIAGTENSELLSIDLPTNHIEILHKNDHNKSIDFLRLDAQDKTIYYASKDFGEYKLLNKQHHRYELAIKDFFKISNKYYAYAASGVCGLFAINKTKDSLWDNSIACRNMQNANGFYSSQPISKVRGKAIAFDSVSKTIYYATHSQLYAASPSSIEAVQYQNNSLLISQLQQYKNEIYALSTQGNLFKIINKNIIPIDPLKHLESVITIKKIKIVSHYLFIISNSDVYWSNLTENVKKIYKLNLTKQNEITDIDIYKDQVVLASDGNLLFEKLDTAETKNANPLFYLHTIKINNKAYDLNIENTFDYLQNNISIDFHILSFKTDSKFPLHYKINDGPWELLAQESRQLLLSSLSPNQYTIQFKLGEINNNQFQSTSIYFEIKKPWWQRWWAYTVFGGLAALLFFGIYRWQTSRLQKKNALLEEKLVLEKNLRTYTLKSIKAQMNPHFFYNALNTIQAFIYDDDKRNASTYLSKFSKLTRTILEMSEKETVTLLEEIEALKLYLDIEKARFTNDFEYTVKINPELDLEFIKIPSMLIQPYVENAVKHGLLHKKELKKLDITFKRIDSDLIINIEDNGIGRQKSEELNKIKNSGHQSFATEANLKRLNLLNNNAKLGIEFIDKRDRHDNATGTIVVIKIPIS